MRICIENTTALIIDMQEKLVPAMSQKEELLHNCLILIQGLQELAVPTAVTQQYSKGLGETISEVKALIPDFNPIEKTDFSCLDESVYTQWLTTQQKKDIILCGIEAHVCVLQTAIDMKQKGFNPVVVFDCISSRTQENKSLVLERLRHEGIMVTSYESVLFELTRSAKAPNFRAISKLVK
ncbi:MAG: hydrolase [Bacteroidota bacterium]|nr:hydrolase [Bacteroidota bacterium]MDP4204640.1 hydrolase [Bacteroidota bacterium]